MKRFGEFIKNALIDGMLVSFPLFAITFIVFLALNYLASPFGPLVEMLFPGSRSDGGPFFDALSISFLLVLCFVIGMAIRTRIGRTLAKRSHLLLSHIPGYRMFNRVARIVFDRDDDSGTPVIVARGDSRQIGFMMEEGEEEMVVFFPDAPSLVSGTVEIVRASIVEKLNVEPVDVARVIGSYGLGLKALLAESGPHEVSRIDNGGSMTDISSKDEGPDLVSIPSPGASYPVR